MIHQFKALKMCDFNIKKNERYRVRNYFQFTTNSKSQNYLSEDNLECFIINYLDDFSSSYKELYNSIELVEYTTYGSIEEVSRDEMKIPLRIVEHYNKNKASYPLEFEIVFVLADFVYKDDSTISGDENVINGIKGIYFVVGKKIEQ